MVTKDPATTFEQYLPDMMDVIGHAARLAADIARQPIAFFDLWRELDRAQGAWARERGIAPLLVHLGVSLVERAVLDGICRIARESLHHLVRNDLGIRLGDVYPELRGLELGEVLPSSPAGRRPRTGSTRFVWRMRSPRPISGLKIAWTTGCRRIWRRRFAPTVCAISR